MFRRADGSILVPQQVVELSRDYVSPPVNVTGTTTEREVLADGAASRDGRFDPAPRRWRDPGRRPGAGSYAVVEMTPERMVALPDDGTLHPVYLIAGPEMLRVLEAADAVRRRARAQGIGERAVFDADGRDFDWGMLEATFNAPSLFSARRLVEVRLPTGKPGKEGIETISSFCANPPPDVILLITAGEWSKAHHGKWTEAVSQDRRDFNRLGDQAA